MKIIKQIKMFYWKYKYPTEYKQAMEWLNNTPGKFKDVGAIDGSTLKKKIFTLTYDTIGFFIRNKDANLKPLVKEGVFYCRYIPKENDIRVDKWVNDYCICMGDNFRTSALEVQEFANQQAIYKEWILVNKDGSEKECRVDFFPVLVQYPATKTKSERYYGEAYALISFGISADAISDLREVPIRFLKPKLNT
jgi:hypothetical protein